MSIAKQLADLKNELAVAGAKSAPDSLDLGPSFREPVLGGPTQPSLDTDKFDDLGNAKAKGPIGTRGPHQAPDQQTAEERTAAAKAANLVNRDKYAPTDEIDSRNHPKGEFEVTPQGHDKHGARIPDKVDYSKPLDAPAVHGPRGKNLPKDCYNG